PGIGSRKTAQSRRFLGGTAGWLEVMLFVMGFAFIALEIFVIPGFGIAGIGGIAMIVASLVLASTRVVIPEYDTDWEQLTSTLTTVGVSMGIALTAAFVMIFYTGKIPLVDRFALQPPVTQAAASQQADGNGETQSTSTSPMDQTTDALAPPWERIQVGDVVTTVSALRPNGKVAFEDEMMDVTSEGEFVDENTEVRVMRVQGNRVVVRPVLIS
ncbi:MAG: NfeD family protein, partial [Planctomycetota bacterium]